MEIKLRYNQNNPFLFMERGGLEGENKYKRGGFLNESKFKKLTGLCPAPIGANFAPNPKAGQVLHAGSPLSSRLHALAYDLQAQSAVFPSNTNGMTENFLWDGLALIHRGTTSFINEPYVTGGNPILSTNDGVMFNDMLGNTIATKNDTLNKINMTAFGSVRRTAEYLGDSDDKAVSERSIFFTGKPAIGELGYAFLFRNYRADQGKWQTSDPLGYPDGWNNLAYCNNFFNYAIDTTGLWRTDGTNYNILDAPLGWNTPTSDKALASLSGYYFDAKSHPISSALVSYAINGTTSSISNFDISQFGELIEKDNGFKKVIDYIRNKVNTASNNSVVFKNDTVSTYLTSADLNTAIHGVIFKINGTITKDSNPWSGDLSISFSDPYDFKANANDFKVRVWGRLWENNWLSRFNVTGKWDLKVYE